MAINDGVLLLNGGLQLRGGRAEVLEAVNPVLSEREIIMETDTGKLKGDCTMNCVRGKKIGG